MKQIIQKLAAHGGTNKGRQWGIDCMISVILLFPSSIRKMFHEAARAALDRKAWISRLR